MNMQNKVIMAPDKGINKYAPMHLVPDEAWSDGNNAYFAPGFVAKVGDWQKFLDGAILAIDNYYRFNGDRFFNFHYNKENILL